MIYWQLFWGFLRVGLFAFGGAYGAIPLIRDVVLSYGWLDEDALTYMIAVSESTPGPIMVNLATYVGASQAGVLGAALATMAVALPAFLIILMVVSVMKTAMKNPKVRAVLRGVNPCVVGIILATALHLIWRSAAAGDMRDGLFTALLALIMFGGPRIFGKKISPIGFIGISAALGILFFGL